MLTTEKQELILMPGLLNDADLWSDQIGALSRVAECRVADISWQESLEEMADSVLADAGPRFAIAGFSLGGYVAQEIARRAPQRVSRLALLDTSIRADTSERAASRRTLNHIAGLPGRFHGFGDRLLSTYLDSSHLAREDIVSRVRAMTERLGPDVFVRQNSVARKDGEDLLRSLACPLLILCGENDTLTTAEEHREMAALARQAQLVIVPESGHLTPLEAPDLVTQALLTWLAER
jgi:pimeloyl-ACP methyl ester carboxylesterase